MDEMNMGALAVRFYQKECENAFLAEQEGRPIKYMADFVRIEIPGNMTSIIDTFANESHKQRFPIEWARYMNEKADGKLEGIQGTVLSDWPLLSSAQASELKHYKFYTVEQVANASDAQILNIGMISGMAPLAFRDKARAFLASAKDSAFVQAQAEEISKRDQEIADLKAQMQELMQSLQPKRGRPAKQEATTEAE